ncbi:hypothetical protein UJ101_00951 [Flavobacteriaceae bacterium UJ101]|nr:hypothetical protein UJ101_00951 [Flavobacteriaceae bacterium UJ101]
MNQTVLDPDFPIVEGDYFLSKYWSITLPIPFNRRVENDSLVLWKPGLTFWMTQFENHETQSPREMVLSLIVDRGNQVEDYKEFEIGETFIAQYFQEEVKDSQTIFSYHYVIASETSMLSVKTYADNQTISKMSKQICQTIKQNM